jgi:DNA polymerase
MAAIQAVLDHRVAGKVMHVLASLLRPTIACRPGRVLIWGDWAAVEARGMPWLAGCEWKLDLYRRGVDVYRVNAEDIFGVPAADATDEQRQIGKVSELSLQFGGAVGALRAMARGYGIGLTEGKAGEVVEAWRAANRWAMVFSRRLYLAFLKTALGTDTSAGPVEYRQIIPLLAGTVSIACDLPGGTTLYYHGVKGHVAVTQGAMRRQVMLRIGDEVETHGLEINPWDTEVVFTKTLPAGFRIERLWHGLLAENVTQALCAALLRDCLGRVEQRLENWPGSLLIGHTHDEIIIEADEGMALMVSDLLKQEMETVPEWLPGFPLAASVVSAPRYGK